MASSFLSDKDIWLAVVNDDHRAFAVLYNRHWKKLYKTFLYYLKDETAAEEILHDVFVVLWRRRKHLNIENFNNYIYITARYHVFKYLKALKLSPIEYIEQYTEEACPCQVSEAEERLDYHDFEIQLTQSLNGLPKRCREIFWLSRIKNLSNEEIAQQLNISKRTVENQITHALKHLRVSYGEFSATAVGVLFVTLFW
ncbi:RNA polymerase sigma-70 factor (plasmid) [Pedobacter sp. BS3]|uniref:RNA polymerase sigma factor n=1 Tax=Pedobacter sp. BS3 TaxID=2567937 RepID=UPI0011EF7C7F|nr:RNA polymerase sigma-70 factor [Pedobacter sp. BS3]TZF85731.1 RNA polymerase sigma-70 factor [Pedobacter sp. BS3]